MERVEAKISELRQIYSLDMFPVDFLQWNVVCNSPFDCDPSLVTRIISTAGVVSDATGTFAGRFVIELIIWKSPNFERLL